MPLPGLLPLPARGLLRRGGDALLPCFAAVRKLRCTLTRTVASVWGAADGVALSEDASGGLLGPSPSGGLPDASTQLLANALKGLFGGWTRCGSLLCVALESGDRLSGLIFRDGLDSDVC